MRESSAIAIEAAWLGVFYQEQSTSEVRAAAVDGAAPAERAGDARREPVRHGHRGAARRRYAVAAGAVDIALAMGVEKLKDTGFGGLPERTKGHVRGPLATRLHAAGRVRAARCARIAAAMA